ncbi:SGNH/GDSL hydrolase family protein [bacterium]|nr:SGNH/GDSL hydrolase family protein [bacterium]
MTARARLLIAVLAALLVVAGVLHLQADRGGPPIGEGPAGPTVAAGPFERAWHAGEALLVGIGDSVTRGYGASPGHSYFELLHRNDDTACPDMRGRDLAHAFPKLRVLNLSVNYTVSADHLARQMPKLPKQAPHVRGIVVITTGGNDLIHDYGRTAPRDGALYGCTVEQARAWREKFRARLAAILDGVQAAFPGGCDIFLANIYDPTDGVGDIENAGLPLPAWPDGLEALALYNEVIADACAARERVHRVDMHALFLGHGIHRSDTGNVHYRKADPHYWYFENLEDPNDRGYDAIRRAFLREMTRVFVSDPKAVPAGAGS